MDDRRFDALTRALGSGQNRRNVLRGLLGLGGGVAALSSMLPTDAARRPAPAPKPRTCPGQQILVGGQCVCPGDMDKCGPDCCEPGISECCDNACCYGVCYGEELCCPTGMLVCDGRCIEGECCTGNDCPSGVCNDDHTCCVPSCGDICGVSDGCNGICGCDSGRCCASIGVCSEGCCPGETCQTENGASGTCQQDLSCCIPDGDPTGGTPGALCQFADCCSGVCDVVTLTCGLG